MALVGSLIKEGWLKTQAIIDAFKKIKRADFLQSSELAAGPEEIQEIAEYDSALSIGCNQTISQPLTVAFMMELLQPEEGDKILDIGSGSGWTTALLSEIVSNGKKNRDGKVIGIEILPELVEFGTQNVSKYNFVKDGIAEIILGNGSKGYSSHAPYDKILCSAALYHKVPDEWFSQLKIGGAMVYPKEESIFKIKKLSDRCCLSQAVKDKDFIKEEYPGFVFVPLQGSE